MIIDRDTNPEQQLYYTGALLIEALKEIPMPLDFFTIYEAYIQMHGKIHVHKFSLTLDWLFMLGIINYQQGELTLCF